MAGPNGAHQGMDPIERSMVESGVNESGSQPSSDVDEQDLDPTQPLHPPHSIRSTHSHSSHHPHSSHQSPVSREIHGESFSRPHTSTSSGHIHQGSEPFIVPTATTSTGFMRPPPSSETFVTPAAPSPFNPSRALTSVSVPVLSDPKEWNINPGESQAFINQKVECLETTLSELKAFLTNRTSLESKFEEISKKYVAQKESITAFKAQLKRASQQADDYYTEKIGNLNKRVSELENLNRSLQRQLAESERKLSRYERKGSSRTPEDDDSRGLKRAFSSHLKEATSNFADLNTPHHEPEYYHS